MENFFKLTVFFLSIYGLALAVAVLKTRALAEAVVGNTPILRDLIKCPPCLSFWIGMTFSVYFFSPSMKFLSHQWQWVVVDGLMACAASWILHISTEKIALGTDA